MIPRELNDQYEFLDIDVNSIDHNEIGVLGCIYDFYFFYSFTQKIFMLKHYWQLLLV